MFGNAKQSIPERFVELMKIDDAIEEIRADIDRVIAGKVITIEQARQLQQELTPYREKLRPLLEDQAKLRLSCERFITEEKARGNIT